MDIKSNKSNRDKERAKENLIKAAKASGLILGISLFMTLIFYTKHHRNDGLMEKIKANKHQLFDESFAGKQNQKVYAYKVVTIEGIYKVEIFNKDGSHSHYASPNHISIIEE